ncbi:hypothetical protein PYW07_008504 [Mythimna separata]|uniref:TRAFD1/XAF1 zinc finger domain-containing protein n=1 Tax=Mythimna separata TaxID=271217 RepID=A0AAD7YDN4_MYTSE|nr:hypothetical protein PYW07_008504 [Mythimna separata]
MIKYRQLHLDSKHGFIRLDDGKHCHTPAAHENYCGVRTEQCPDCREWVMIKYRQLHLDSNHGFIRLDDDPAPAPKKEPPKNAAKPINTRIYQPNQNTNLGTGNTNIPFNNDGFARPSTSGGVSRTTTTAKLNIEYSPASTSNANNGFSRPTGLNIEITGATKSKNGLTPPTPDQISISIASRDVATKSAAGTPKNTPGTPKAAPQTPKTAEEPKTAADGHWVPRDGAWVDPEAPWTDPQAPFTDSGATSVNSGYLSGGSSTPSSPTMTDVSSSTEWTTLTSQSYRKRTNDQPQINSDVDGANKVHKRVCNCRGAVKKRPAPKPPLRSPPPAPTRDMPYYSALQRQQQEERARQEQTAYNLSVGESQHIKKRPAPKPPLRSPPPAPTRDMPYYSALQRQQQEERARQEQTAYNLSVGESQHIKKRPAPKPPLRSPPPAPTRDMPYYSALQRQQQEERARQEQTAYNLSVAPKPPLRSPPPAPTRDMPYYSALQRQQQEERARQEQTAYNLSVAPKPPLRSPPPAPTRDMPYYSALQRQQQEERARQEQTAYNLSLGLPPVLSPAAKLDKLRKMDALQNPESFIDYRNRVRGRMGRQPDLPYPSSPCTCYPETLASEDPERRRQEFKNLKPMTPQEFLERFTEMQLKEDEPRQKNGEGEARRRSGDRFSEIKSSLRELRRGLNEVTAPYHANPNGGANANNNNNNNGNERAGPAFPRNEVVDLPCEFCNCLIPAHNLVQHQTGCRPDLAQLRPRSPSPVGAGALPHAPLPEPVIPCEFCARSLPLYLISEHQHTTVARSPSPGGAGAPLPEPVIPCEFCARSLPLYLISEHQHTTVARSPSPGGAGAPLPEPVIPCEFCARSLPLYLISEHQERCGREANLLYPD